MSYINKFFPEEYLPTPKKKKKKKKKLPEIVRKIQSYNPEEINYTFQKNISYSQFSMYNECPKKWSLNYVEGYKTFNSTIHTVFGTSIHTVLQHYLQVMYDVSGAAADREDLESLFEKSLRKEYKEQYIKNKKKHFSDPQELREFYEDGLQIIRYFKKHKSEYFGKRGWYLAGCEIPIVLTPNYKYNNVIYQGFLDVVMYHEPTKTFKIIDIKTSTGGWGKEAKKEENKQFQLILYKKFFSETFNIPLDQIKIEFFIVKRKVYDHPDYHISRIQQFVPASGKVKLNKVDKALNKFITEAFTVNNEYSDRQHQPKVSKKCGWCPFHKTVKCSATYEK